MSIKDTIPTSVTPAGFKAWAEAVSDAVIAVVQTPGATLPARPNAVVVHWYSWDAPPLSSAHPYDQWFEIPIILTEAAPLAFTVGQWAVSDTESGGEISIAITELPLANPAITDLEYRIDSGAAVSLNASTIGSYSVSGLTDDVSVNVQVRAVNSEGAAEWSDTKAVTPTTGIASIAPGWMDSDDTDPYGFDTMRTSDAGTGDPVAVNDSVGWAETFSA